MRVDRSPDTPRRALVAGTAIVVLLTVLWAAAFDTLVPGLGLFESWGHLAETGGWERIGLAAAVTLGIVVVLVVLGWVWIGRTPRIAPGIRRWAVAVFLFATVVLVATTWLPWTVRMAARGDDPAAAGAFVSFIPHAIALTAWVLSGVTIVVFALIAVVAEDRRHRDE